MKRIPIRNLKSGDQIQLAGGKVMTVTAKPYKKPDETWAVPNDIHGETTGHSKLTFLPYENTDPIEEKQSEPQ